jgi:hypothetical protein
LKLNRDGIFEVTPGFSSTQRDYYDGDSEIFLSPENLEEKSRNNCTLKPFTFRTLDGLSFQYTIQWINKIDDWQQLEEASLARSDEDYRLLSERRKLAVARVNDLIVDHKVSKEEQLLHLEITHASGFDTDEAIFIKYQVATLGEWEVDTSCINLVDNKVCLTNTVNEVKMVFEGQTSPGLPVLTNMGGANGRNLTSLLGVLIIFSVKSN